MDIESKQKSSTKDKTVEAKREGKFNQSIDEITATFFEDFLKKNAENIISRNLGLVSNSLESEVFRFLNIAKKEKGEEYTNILANHFLTELGMINVYNHLPDEAKVETIKYLNEYTAPWRGKI